VSAAIDVPGLTAGAGRPGAGRRLSTGSSADGSISPLNTSTCQLTSACAAPPGCVFPSRSLC